MRLIDKFRYIKEEIDIVELVVIEAINIWENLKDYSSEMSVQSAMTIGAKLYYGFVGIDAHTYSGLKTHVENIQEMFIEKLGKEVTPDLLEDVIESLFEKYGETDEN